MPSAQPRVTVVNLIESIIWLLLHKNSPLQSRLTGLNASLGKEHKTAWRSFFCETTQGNGYTVIPYRTDLKLNMAFKSCTGAFYVKIKSKKSIGTVHLKTVLGLLTHYVLESQNVHFPVLIWKGSSSISERMQLLSNTNCTYMLNGNHKVNFYSYSEKEPRQQPFKV